MKSNQYSRHLQFGNVNIYNFIILTIILLIRQGKNDKYNGETET